MKETIPFSLLEKRFHATVVDEIIPGIFHNFANPLNGIMGRSRLMEKRLSEYVERMESRYPDIQAEMGADCRKLMSDISSISRESEKFFELFHASTGKFHSIGIRENELIDLASLVASELAFTDFYLDFKHNIIKNTRLDAKVPPVQGITAFYSLALGMLLLVVMRAMRRKRQETIFTTATRVDSWVAIVLTPVDRALMEDWQRGVASAGLVAEAARGGQDEDRQALLGALALLGGASDGVCISYDQAAEELTIRVPCHREAAIRRR